MAYIRAAAERAMTVREAILRALSGRQSWLRVADVLGSARARCAGCGHALAGRGLRV